MSKIFRLHSGGSDIIKHWALINGHLSENFINTINDPAGATSSNQITSIPSPFARIDLVRTAFRHVGVTKQLEGDSIYHRIVSDSLDVAQIFFNIEAFKDKIEIISWDPGIIKVGNKISIDAKSNLGSLIYSKSKKHELYGRTLELFLTQDASTYNFADIKRFYLLNFKSGPDPINIVGGTSPSTLFFSSANDDLASYVGIQFGADKVFDDKFCPLMYRNNDFVLFMYSLKYSMPHFADRFKDVDNYLDEVFHRLSAELQDEIREFLNISYLTNYLSTLSVTHIDNPGNNAEILNYELRHKSKERVESDFEIASTKPIEGLKPLVLPNEQFNSQLNYVGGKWQHDYKAPYYDSHPLNQRNLPHQTQIKHPYLTVSDLLEPYIIKLPYPINKNKFINGNFDGDKHGFVLPIRKDFFKYFAIHDIVRPLPDGKRMFEIVPLPNEVVKAILRIPIKAEGKYIEFSRAYSPNQFPDKLEKPDQQINKGIILENQFGITIYPFLKTGLDNNAHYRVMLIDKDTSQLTKFNEYSIQFYKDNNTVDLVKYLHKKNRSNKHQGYLASSFYYVLEAEFDFIEVKNNNATGILIPIFKEITMGSKKFTFAMDFGTTNTHIEYKIENEREKPFEINEGDIQIGSLNDNDQKTIDLLKNPALGPFTDILVNLIPVEFLPEKIGKNSNYYFPQRTVIADNDQFDPESDSTYALADFNIPFTYLKETIPSQIEITANLKWSDFKNDKKLRKRTEAFIDTLLLLIRNKIILNGGSLKEAQILWFYPTSMSEFRKGVFQSTWEELCAKYIQSNKRVEKMSESLAPFYFYKERGGILAFDKPVACIDVGGATTDIVIYKDNKPIYLTSFKFAANAIFGDGYGNSPSTNGFVLKYEPWLLNSLSNSSARDLLEILKDLKNKHSKSIELIEFFFSIDSNKKVKDSKLPISFAKELANDSDLKIVFLFFYASIIYHLAKLMKVENLEPPRFITFSGTGSKVLNITDPSPGIRKLTEYTKLIFEEVYDNIITARMELKQFDEPKEISCKGGLLCNNYSEVDEIEESIKAVLIGDENDTIIPKKPLKYSEVENEDLLKSVMREVNSFIDKFFSWNDILNYNNKFGINQGSFNLYKKWMKEDMKEYLLAGVKEKISEVQDNSNINVEETLFFYPLIGGLNKLAFKIQSTSGNQNSNK